MKLHLPVSLFKCLMSLLPVVAAVTGMSVSASVLHQDASVVTYTDFGQNAGRYSVGVTNALLQYVNRNGVVITYTGGQADYTLAHGMIDFSAGYYRSTAAAISANCVATVKHNGAISSDFTSQYYGIGSTNAIRYKAIEYAGDATFSNVVDPSHPSGAANYQTDHKVTRLSKIITDVSPAEIYDNSQVSYGMLGYHAGSGRYITSTHSGGLTQIGGAYNYVTGGVMQLWGHQGSPGGSLSVYHNMNYGAGGISSGSPLPWISQGGDSGSPLYVWNDATQSYQYFGGTYGGDAGNRYTVIASNTTFDKQTVESFNEYVQMQGLGTICLNAVTGVGQTITSGGHTTTKKYGTVTDASGNVLTNAAGNAVEYYGLASGLNTWGDLSGLKDTQNWYSYGQNYVQPSIEDLFYTENLVFESSGSENNIRLNATVDLGVGYAQFSRVNGAEGVVRFDISSAGDGSYQFNHAGYVIDAGVEVHTTLTGDANHMYEWRKIGGGDLYIEGSGNNNILLNVGGNGKTYLNRTNGYAAYNVLVNNGSTVVIRDINQIKRDLTFGNRGGTLDLNDQDMDWYLTAEGAESGRAGFSINALTEAAVIANYTGSSTITYKEGGNTRYLGSFADSATASLKVIYDAGGRWELNSIRTNLQHADSGLQVNNGTVVLCGTNTVHAYGSDLSTADDRYFNADDWHYADAAMNVAVQNGGTFELGSHARLTGDVSVEQGGTYVMREAVRHQMEYVEGGYHLEDTSIYSEYFGHKGNVQLNGGTFAVQFNDGVDSNTSYAGNVMGTGAMTVDAGISGGTFTFSGSVDSGIRKTLNRGQLILTGTAAADTANKWLVNAGGVMVQFENAQDTLALIDSTSTGVLGLTQDYTTQLNLGSHAGLGIGALSGTTVQYGAAGTTERLTTLNFGGGGKLVVNYALAGTDTLNVNAGGMAGGEIHLANVAQNYTGTVNVQAVGGAITLTTAADGALNGATVNLNNGGIWKLAAGQTVGGTVNVNAGGTLQGKNMVLTGTANLAGSLDYNSFTVQDGGRLVMQNGGTFDADHAVTIANGGTLDLNGTTFTQNVQVTQGGEMNARNAGIAAGAGVEIAGGTLYAQGAVLASGSLIKLADGGTMYGNGTTYNTDSTITATHGTGILDVGESVDISGLVGADAGATLTLKGTAVTLRASYINTQGGTLDIQSSRLSLTNFNRIGGTLSFGADTTVDMNLCGLNTSVQSHAINALEIRDNHSVTIHQTESTISHVWNIGSLTGSGELLWKVQPYSHKYGTSRMILSGPGEFNGTIRVIQDYPSSGWYWNVAPIRLAQLELAHDDAAQGAVISLESASWVTNGDRLAQQRSGLAVNTANAHIAGLNGTQYSEIFAGAAITAHTTSMSSTARNTLTITGSGEYQYAGHLQGNEEFGLSIVMDGTGKQTFTSAWNTVHDVSALRGELVFTNTPTVHGDVSIAQGAELTLGSGAFSLDAGKTLNVLRGNDGGLAVLNNSLVINGGVISIGAYNDNAASLSLGSGCTVAGGDSFAGVTLKFSNLGTIVANQQYLLVGGDWRNISVTSEDCSYLNVNLATGANGLTAVFSLKDGYEYWMGNEENWTPSKDNVVITGMEPYSKVVEVRENLSLRNGVVDNVSSVTIQSQNQSTLSFSNLEKYGAGELTINSAVEVQSLKLKEAATIGGSGVLRVNSLQLEADLVTRMALDVTQISNDGSYVWSMDGTKNSFSQNLTVDQAGSFGRILVEGNANLVLDTANDAQLGGSISGSGIVSKTGAGKLTLAGTFNVGTFNLNGGSLYTNKAFEIGTLNVADGLTVELRNEGINSPADKKIGTLQLGNGATFQTYDVKETTTATRVNELRLTGGVSTVKDLWNSSYFVYESLTLAEGASSSELRLIKTSQSSKTAVFELGAAGVDGGNFVGDITLDVQTTGTGRPACIVISNPDVAKNAVISVENKVLESGDAGLPGSSWAGVGINADNTIIGGLESNQSDGANIKLFSGSIGASQPWHADSSPSSVGDAERTLYIRTAENGDYHFYGEVQKKLNIVKTGKGTQTFSGASADFNGGITVEQGTLGVGVNALGMLRTCSQINIEEGGVLSLTGFAKDNVYDLTITDQITNRGTVELNFAVDGNGSGFDFRDTVDSFTLTSGRVRMDTSHFNVGHSPTFIIASDNGQFVFNGNGTNIGNDVILESSLTVHANSGKDGTLSGNISGDGGSR